MFCSSKHYPSIQGVSVLSPPGQKQLVQLKRRHCESLLPFMSSSNYRAEWSSQDSSLETWVGPAKTQKVTAGEAKRWGTAALQVSSGKQSHEPGRGLTEDSEDSLRVTYMNISWVPESQLKKQEFTDGEQKGQRPSTPVLGVPVEFRSVVSTLWSRAWWTPMSLLTEEAGRLSETCSEPSSPTARLTLLVLYIGSLNKGVHSLKTLETHQSQPTLPLER